VIDPTANEFVFGDTYRQGVYRLHLGTNETAFCVDLLDAAESNIKPRDALQLGQYTRIEATTLQRTNMELWRTIAGLGLAVLLIEWWVLSSEDGVINWSGSKNATDDGRSRR